MTIYLQTVLLSATIVKKKYKKSRVSYRNKFKRIKKSRIVEFSRNKRE